MREGAQLTVDDRNRFHSPPVNELPFTCLIEGSGSPFAVRFDARGKMRLRKLFTEGKIPDRIWYHSLSRVNRKASEAGRYVKIRDFEHIQTIFDLQANLTVADVGLKPNF